MALPLTPAILAASYEFLRQTPPFSRWKLPPAEVVQFRVIKSQRIMGDHSLYGDTHRIRISEGRVGRLDTLLTTMAHEMIHAHLDRQGVRSDHGEPFQRCARQVCKSHSFDPKMFC